MNQNEPLEITTMPVPRPEPAQISQKPKQEVSQQPSDYIKQELIRYPMYDYKTGTQFFLSKTQRIVVDAYLETHNVSEACRTLNAIHGAHGSSRKFTPGAVNRWLQKPHVASHVAQGFIDQGKVNWFDIAKWEAWGVDVMQGKTPATQVQVAVWKEFGKAKGWYKETGGNQMIGNMQINFVQSDGRA